MRKHRMANFGLHIPIHITNIYGTWLIFTKDILKKNLTKKAQIRYKNAIQRWNPDDLEIMNVKSDYLSQRIPFLLGVEGLIFLVIGGGFIAPVSPKVKNFLYIYFYFFLTYISVNIPLCISLPPSTIIITILWNPVITVSFKCNLSAIY